MSPSTPGRPPGTPPPADPGQSPLPPRNDHVDADTSAQRKRPRLDSGDRAYQNMSAESSGQGVPPDTPTKQVISPTPTVAGTPSRVTINVRPPVREASPVNALVHETESVHLRSQHDATAAQGVDTNLAPSSPPVATETTPATSSSPEIEVAGPEDLDGAGATVWIQPLDVEDVEENFNTILMDEFPYAGRYNSYEATLEDIKSYLVNREGKNCTDVLETLTEWLGRYLRQTEKFSDKWFDLFNETRDFWDAVPGFVDAILHRAAVPGVRRDISASERSAAVEEIFHPGPQLLQAYAHLTARMLLIDARTLQENATDQSVRPDLMSSAYLHTLARCICPVGEPLLVRKLVLCGYNLDAIVQDMLKAFFVLIPQGLEFLTRHTLNLLSRATPDEDALAASFELVRAVIAHWSRIVHSAGEAEMIRAEHEPALAKFFDAIHDRLLELIQQQSSSLRHDHIKLLVDQLTRLLRESVAYLGFAFPKQTPDGYGLSSVPRDSAHRAFLINASWKMAVFEACITKGHMDARIYGVKAMQELLQDAFDEYAKDTPQGSPLDPAMCYLADFIQHRQLVRYLVGIGSHRQLVSRSAKIVAFLVVTDRYANSDTDTIWEALRSSQDPRVADSIAEMTQNLLSHSRYPMLQYLFGKFQQLPTAAFDARLRLLCHNLFEAILGSPGAEHDSTERNTDMALFFARILQELYVQRELSVEQRREIKKFASYELAQVLRCTHAGLDRMTIFSKCLREVSKAGPLAWGSGSVIAIILDHRPVQGSQAELLQLEADFGFTQHIVDDISRLGDAKTELNLDLADFHDLLMDRLLLLIKIIIYLPSKLTPDLTASFWTSLVGCDAVDNHCRATAWTMLGNAVSFCTAEHRELIERLTQVHFPALHPSCYALETLAFADRAANYELQFSQHKEENVVGASAVFCYSEILWSIALKTTSQDIACRAIENLVQRQLKGGGIVVRGSENDKVQGHAKFVERIVEEVIRSAKEFKSQRDGTNLSEDENMIILATQRELAQTRVRFQNSLAILLKFVELVRSSSPISPRSDSIKSGGASALPGDKVSIRYQAHAAGKTFAQSRFEVGDLATVKDLSNILMARTGFNKLKIIAGGATIDISSQSDTSIRDIPSLQRGLVLVQKIPSDTVPRVLQLHPRLTPLEEEVMRHFEALYGLLDLDNTLGREVFDFLSSFPPHPDILANVCDYSKSTSDIFPPDSSFKSLYSIYALQTSLAACLQQGVAAVDLLAHGTRNISAAILALDSTTCALAHPGSVAFASTFVEALLIFLKEPVPTAVSATYFEQPNTLVDRLAMLVTRALELDLHINTVRLIEFCFKVMLEASLHRPELRAYMASQSEVTSLVKRLILESPHVPIRETIRRALESFFAALSSTSIDARDDYFSFFWGLFQPWIPDAAKNAYQTEQFFSIANCVFQNLSDESRAALPLRGYRAQWSHLLCAHKHIEFVGQFSTDWVTMGLASLLHWCIASGKSEPSMQLDHQTIDTLFQEHLFSKERYRGCLSVEAAQTPVLDPKTRARIYGLLLSSMTNPTYIQVMIRLCQDILLSFDASYAWTWGYARLSTTIDDYNENRSFERRTAIRAPTGYAGLRNLSNTCYLNSLCTQLFMNVEFRSFLLSLSVSDARSSQKLVYEMKRLFSYLQHTWLHAVDPETVTDAIITYEGTIIDVAIQMDVDEFYNLLFDRIESQIQRPDEKRAFRKFYGGHLVQQIKSKDCEHISERFEPFSAIQCEIQGKSTLHESLSAYVEGETMEGDNKYSCSSCGSYVNAVKRACLKDVPDDLIFHLKRFDYDLATGTRNKINDYFAFPFEIDMAPYNIDYLKDTSTPSTPDIFTLVGVLVHTGQAEAGHYYSFIRDRSQRGDVWFEFNDSEVTGFDPANMQSACFGGVQDTAFGNEPFMKPWSAYMLFYRRKTVFMDTTSTTIARSVAASRVPPEIGDRIRSENGEFIQKYCMFDDEHGNFVTSLLEKHIHFRETSACSDDHNDEASIINFAIDHLDLIFSRQKDSKHALPMLGALKRMTASCLECAKILLNRFIQSAEMFQSLLVKCPMDHVRTATADLIRHLLQSIRDADPDAYGLSVSPGSEWDMAAAVSTEFLKRLCKTLSWMQFSLHESSKGWDDFYALLMDIASFGSFERATLQGMGFLLHCLSILAILTCKSVRSMLSGYGPFLKAFERRHFSFLNLIALVELLIREAEVSSEESSGDEDDSSNRNGPELDPQEQGLLVRKTTKDIRAPLAVLEAVFRHTKDDLALSERFVGTLLSSTLFEHRGQDIANTILGGLCFEVAGDSEPYLRGAVAFCEHSSERTLIKDIIRVAGKEIPKLSNSGGGAFLEFFQRVYRAHNIHILPLYPLYFKKSVVDTVGRYGASLLYYPKSEVRTKTLDFFVDMLAERQRSEDDEYGMSIDSAALTLGDRCAQVVLSWGPQTRIDVRRTEQVRDFLKHLMAAFLMNDNLHIDEEEIVIGRNKIELAISQLESLTTSTPDDDILSTATCDSDSGMTDFSAQAEA